MADIRQDYKFAELGTAAGIALTSAYKVIDAAAISFAADFSYVLGTPAAGPLDVTITKGVIDTICLYFMSEPLGTVGTLGSFNSGHSGYLDVTTGDANATLTGTDLFLVDSAGVVKNRYRYADTSVNLGTPGLVVTSDLGWTSSATYVATDRVCYAYRFTNAAAHSAAIIQIAGYAWDIEMTAFKYIREADPMTIYTDSSVAAMPEPTTEIFATSFTNYRGDYYEWYNSNDGSELVNSATGALSDSIGIGFVEDTDWGVSLIHILYQNGVNGAMIIGAG